ncbi:adenosylcobinamide-GDP ribazoletransferase [Actinophytocola oryzae]|uniref:Adenosylcobinamide-GDP ribazoletransferase n=1 Tax=Actinophytocola oryzae TaxID=502181 RepID=A0A4R7UWJ5_9PSEU|nr:adenosylcobinamide-GDP ribazoletransferase [Actinophytocola oryzae]TDV40437.1 cobalamin-5'-phosphate synthase [Actinophytocola oryzae]
MAAGVRLAFSWLTVLPMPVGQVDRAVAGAAITSAPLVGLVLGGVAAGLWFLLDLAGLGGLLAGLLVVAFLALATRGMHLDGLADTADGLGSYADAARALAIMREGPVGPFGAVALVLTIGIQAAAINDWPELILAVTTGRVAFVLCCHNVPAARQQGLGALVAGTQSLAAPVFWLIGLLLVSPLADIAHPYKGPVAIVVATGLVLLLCNHVQKRFGGITGDVLGAAGELAATAVLVVVT